jgi:hypothetical protein
MGRKGRKGRQGRKGEKRKTSEWGKIKKEQTKGTREEETSG